MDNAMQMYLCNSPVFSDHHTVQNNSKSALWELIASAPLVPVSIYCKDYFPTLPFLSSWHQISFAGSQIIYWRDFSATLHLIAVTTLGNSVSCGVLAIPLLMFFLTSLMNIMGSTGRWEEGDTSSVISLHCENRPLHPAFSWLWICNTLDSVFPSWVLWGIFVEEPCLPHFLRNMDWVRLPVIQSPHKNMNSFDVMFWKLFSDISHLFLCSLLPLCPIANIFYPFHSSGMRLVQAVRIH